jgi:hypothetical protein
LVCLHLSTQPTWPQLCVCFVFCLLSFLHLPLPPVRFLGQAHVARETYSSLKKKKISCLNTVALRVKFLTRELWKTQSKHSIGSNTLPKNSAGFYCLSCVQDSCHHCFRELWSQEAGDCELCHFCCDL